MWRRRSQGLAASTIPASPNHIGHFPDVSHPLRSLCDLITHEFSICCIPIRYGNRQMVNYGRRTVGGPRGTLPAPALGDGLPHISAYQPIFGPHRPILPHNSPYSSVNLWFAANIWPFAPHRQFSAAILPRFDPKPAYRLDCAVKGCRSHSISRPSTPLPIPLRYRACGSR